MFALAIHIKRTYKAQKILSIKTKIEGMNSSDTTAVYLKRAVMTEKRILRVKRWIIQTATETNLFGLLCT